MRIKIRLWPAILFFFSTLHVGGWAQEPLADTLQGLDSVRITGHLFQLRGETLSAVAWNREQITVDVAGPGGGWFTALNQAPGVQLEERSPGSLRMSIRGSSLRSPFGVRNVKMYYNGLPITDAGGNTYLNMLSPSALGSVELAKGPAASMYGTGTGGVMWMQSPGAAPRVSLQAEGGSYGQARLGVNMYNTGEKYQRSFLSMNTHYAKGYRQQTESYGWNSAFVLNLNGNRPKEFTILTNQIRYGTPGGLTRAQMLENPRMARPAAGTQPSAEAVDAHILQQNMAVGFTRKSRVQAPWQNTSSLFAMLSSVMNSSIRNYETRLEPVAGLRSTFTRSFPAGLFNSVWTAGTEWQLGGSGIKVHDNHEGEKGDLQTEDVVLQWNGFVFVQHELALSQRLRFVQGISANHQSLLLNRKAGPGKGEHRKTYALEWMPRFQLEYSFSPAFRTQLVASRGFSPPTLGEVIPSTTIINTELAPETGWNLEWSNRLRMAGGRLQWQSSLYRFDLKNAIVQQRDDAGADFFINAGSVKQWGIENQLTWNAPSSNRTGFSLQSASFAHQYQPYRFTKYNKNEENFDGHHVPGVPEQGLTALITVLLPGEFRLMPSWFYQSPLWLNDANTEQSGAMNRVMLRLEKTLHSLPNRQWRIFAGVDNLLNDSYSFGYDINAFGGRFYNPAPERRFFIGVSMRDF